MSVRLQTLLSTLGVDSRRHCASVIAGGAVRVNGTVVREPGFRVERPETDVVEVNGDFFYCDSYKWEKITFPKKETTDKPYKVVTWNFRAKRPNKPHFFKTDDEALLFGNSQIYNSRVEIVEYFHLEDGEWIKY